MEEVERKNLNVESIDLKKGWGKILIKKSKR